MLYLGTTDIETIGKDWQSLVRVIGDATRLIYEGNFAQPVKPYLRYGDRTNRIIAMPAFLGGDISLAGLKWIASFPGNLEKGLARAHSVTILNDAEKGVPISVINTTLVSAIRTAAVSGFFLNELLSRRTHGHKLNVGVTGFGPIGKTHVEMITALFGNLLASVSVYDIRPVDESLNGSLVNGVPVAIVGSWSEAYENADIFITCTVSRERYIDKQPKKGSLQLNVSLRDYAPTLRKAMTHIVVDDWEEICRENTDIEKMHLEEDLQKDATHSLMELACSGKFPTLQHDDVVMFNPMGMAVYDVAIAGHYYKMASANKVGTNLQ